MDEKDIQQAFYCGHKLDNKVHNVYEELRRFDTDILDITEEDWKELLMLAKDAAYHIKWMVAKLRQLNEKK